MSETNIESVNHAFRIAALPEEYGEVMVNQLFTRGYACWETPDGHDRQALINSVEKFGNMAIASDGEAIAEYIEYPSELAVVATLAAITVEKSQACQSIPRWKNQPFENLQQLYTNTLEQLLVEYDDPAIEQDLAEVLFSKSFGENESYLGRLCTDVVHRPDLDSPHEWFLQFPVAAASQKCIVTTEDLPTPNRGGRRRNDTNTDREQQRRLSYLDDVEDSNVVYDGGRRVHTTWENNFIYVPVIALYQRFRRYMSDDGGAFEWLVDVHKTNLSPEQHEWILSNITRLQEKLMRLKDHKHFDELWRDWEPGQELVDVLINALKTADELSTGEYYKASELYSALETYHPEDAWEKHVIEDIGGARGLGVKLANNQENSAIDVKEHDRYHAYKIGWESSSASEIEVTELEDFFELPCFKKMEQRLHEKGPVRKDLYNLVRMAWWLPQYGEDNKEELIEDIKDLFSRWPWFDPHITEQQSRYELRPDNTITGPDGEERPPLPRNCNNGHMERYCIGRDVCPYTIYSSVPFRDEMFEVLEELLESQGSS